MPERLTGKVALVTGAASGIGLALGRLLLNQGLRVIFADIDEAGLAREAASFSPHGCGETLTLDVTDAAAVQAVIDGIVQRHGSLDYLFNNAGVGGTLAFRAATLAHWRRIIELNLMGVVHGVQAAYPHMQARGAGHIINTASISGLVPWPGQTLYNTTKYAIVGLSHTLQPEAARCGVKISVVCPGPVQSAIWRTPIIGARGSQKPPASAMPAGEAAAAIWRGVQRNQATIILPAQSARQAWLYRVFPWALRDAFERQLSRSII